MLVQLRSMNDVEGYARGLLQEINSASISPVAASDGGDTPEQTSYNNPFDVNSHFSPTMIIILVILLSAFLFMGFFAVYVRRCTSDEGNFSGHGYQQRGDEQTSSGAASTLPATGVEHSIVESYPLVSYAVARKRGCNECVVCLNDFDKDEELRQLPKCKHVFHRECIGSWLDVNKTCPLCRRNLVSGSDKWSICLSWGGSRCGSVRTIEDASSSNNLRTGGEAGGSSEGRWLSLARVEPGEEGSSNGGGGGVGGSGGSFSATSEPGGDTGGGSGSTSSSSGRRGSGGGGSDKWTICLTWGGLMRGSTRTIEDASSSHNLQAGGEARGPSQGRRLSFVRARRGEEGRGGGSSGGGGGGVGGSGDGFSPTSEPDGDTGGDSWSASPSCGGSGGGSQESPSSSTVALCVLPCTTTTRTSGGPASPRLIEMGRCNSTGEELQTEAVSGEASEATEGAAPRSPPEPVFLYRSRSAEEQHARSEPVGCWSLRASPSRGGWVRPGRQVVPDHAPRWHPVKVDLPSEKVIR